MLGRGGMGVVYRATDRVLGRTVAVKVLPAERAEDPTFVTRFEREARAAASLSHPSIVAVYDSGRDGDTRFIVMECVPGESLGQLLRQRHPLPAADAVEIAAEVASALAAAHRAGIIHRDIKPGNVMVNDELQAKVLDFGIARAIATTSLTNTAIILGSAPYMAPEVTRGETADERSDIYSLGCMLYEMLTGGPPFTGELGAAVMHQHNTASPRPLRELNPATPAALDALVMQMLAKQPNERPQRASELVDALRACAALPGAVGAAGTAVTEPTRVLPRAVPRRSRERIALAAAIALILIVVAIVASGSSSPTRHAVGARTARANTVARKPSTRAATTSTPPAKRQPSTTSAPTSPPTVAGAAGALETLANSDRHAGTIDQQAGQQVLGGLQDILTSYNAGNANDAVHKVSDLASHVAQLSARGDIQASALPALSGAIYNLRSALASGASASSQPAGPAAQPGRPGPGGKPPKHGKH